jgi:hypothetical protein
LKFGQQKTHISSQDQKISRNWLNLAKIKPVSHTRLSNNNANSKQQNEQTHLSVFNPSLVYYT